MWTATRRQGICNLFNTDVICESWVVCGVQVSILFSRSLKILEWNGVSLVDRSFEEVCSIMDRVTEVVELVVEHATDFRMCDLLDDNFAGAAGGISTGASKYTARKSASDAVSLGLIPGRFSSFFISWEVCQWHLYLIRVYSVHRFIRELDWKVACVANQTETSKDTSINDKATVNINIMEI